MYKRGNSGLDYGFAGLFAYSGAGSALRGVDSAARRPDSVFRTAPTFKAASEKYTRFNRILAIGVGDRRPSGLACRARRIPRAEFTV